MKANCLLNLCLKWKKNLRKKKGEFLVKYSSWAADNDLQVATIISNTNTSNTEHFIFISDGTKYNDVIL